jgi:hypothetical protein
VNTAALTLPLATALVAGLSHALEPDHMAAVTAFVSRRPHPLRALGFGVQWAVGHSVALLLAGGAVILLNLELSPALVSALEFAVGAMLFGIGLWALGGALHLRAFIPAHGHAHAHGHPHSHVQGQATTWVGAAHGLAGTAGFVTLLPVAFISSPWLAGGYLLFFGLGTVVSMGLYALVAGFLFHHAGRQAPALGRGLRVAASLASVGVGVLWMRASIG